MEQINLNEGEKIRVMSLGSLFYFDMVYEGNIEGDCGFLNQIPGVENIMSWRERPEKIRIIEGKPREVILSSRRGVDYNPLSREYQNARGILINGGVWR